MTTDPPLWHDTRALIRSDYDRFRPLMTGMSLPKRLFWCLLPQFQGLVMHRTARHLHLHGKQGVARLLYLFGTYLTRVDITPETVLGAGCWLGHPPVVLRGRIGTGLTCLGCNGILGRDGGTEQGDGLQLPVIGNDVSLALDAAVIGPVRIGDNVRFGPRALVTRDVAAGAFVAAPPSRVLRDPDRAADAAPNMSLDPGLDHP